MGLSKAQIVEGNFAEAARQLEPLAKIQPKNAEIWHLLALAYKGLGKTAEAQRAEIQEKSLKQSR